MNGGRRTQGTIDAHTRSNDMRPTYRVQAHDDSGTVVTLRDSQIDQVVGARQVPRTGYVGSTGGTPAPGGPKRGSLEAKIETKKREIERRVGAVSIAREARANTGARIQSTRESRANAALSKARSELMQLERELRERDAAAPESTGPTPAAPAPGLRQRAERTDRKAELRAMSDADLQNAYRNAGALEAKELRAEIERRENLIPADLAGGAGATRQADGTIRVGGLREGQRWVTPAGLTVANPSQSDIINGRVKLRQSGGTGPGNVPVGGTDADRRAARPRIEGETDRAYEVRTAPTREAALSILNGNQAAGLRAIARAEGIVTSGSKADLVARLIRVMRDRHEDSAAIERMVNRDRPAAPTVKAEDLRANDMVKVGDTWGLVKKVQTYTGTNLPTEVQVSYDGGARTEWVKLSDITAHESRRANTTGGPAPAPTMTGSQLLAQRRAPRSN